MSESTAPLGSSRYEKGHLISPLEPAEKELVSDLMEQVFVIHGKHTSAKARSILTDEIAHSGIPFKFLVAGLRDLKEAEDLPGLELWRIRAACRKRQHAEYKTADCEACGVGGTVTMIYKAGDRRGVETNLACSCANGDRWVRGSKDFKALLRWNGEAEQAHGPYVLVLWAREAIRPSLT